MTTLHESSCLAAPTPPEIEQAALRAVAYADVFDYPLQATEIHRYLHGFAASPEATSAALARCSTPGGALSSWNSYYTLRGREGLVEVRSRRAARADHLWPAALSYGRLIAGLPFVRMVAVTGSLMWHNVDDEADIDYLIVTEPGRMWVCRWLIAALCRAARLDGVWLCANYVLSTRALQLADRNLYTAYELARMTPIAGLGMYRRLRRANAWAATYLPNAVEPPRLPVGHPRPAHTMSVRVMAHLVRLGERVLGSPVGAALEAWEMKYRIRKRVRLGSAQGEASYGLDWFKEHTSGHRERALAAFAERLRNLGEATL